MHDYARGYTDNKVLGERERDITQGLSNDGRLNAELLPTALNLRNMEEFRHRQTLQQASEQEKVKVWQLNHATKQFIDAYEQGDQAEMQRIIASTMAMGIELNADATLEGHEMAAMYERITRDLMADPAKFPQEMWNLMQRGRPTRSRERGPE